MNRYTRNLKPNGSLYRIYYIQIKKQSRYDRTDSANFYKSAKDYKIVLYSPILFHCFNSNITCTVEFKDIQTV